MIVNICDCKWIIFYGIKYIFNECSLLLWVENERFVFGDFFGIWIVNGIDVIFRVVEFEIVIFSDIFNLYEIDKLG